MGRAPWHRTEREDDDDRVVAESMERADVADARATGSTRRCPAASRRGRRSPGCSPRRRRCCCSTSRPRRSTSGTRSRCSRSPARPRRPARPSSSCCTTCPSPRRTPTGSACSRTAGCAPTARPTDVLTAELLTEVYEHPVEVIDARRQPARRAGPVARHRRARRGGPMRHALAARLSAAALAGRGRAACPPPAHADSRVDRRQPRRAGRRSTRRTRPRSTVSGTGFQSVRAGTAASTSSSAP